MVYKLTPSGLGTYSETVLYRFTGGTDGRFPVASPIADAAGNLYGTAALGGDLACTQGQGEGCGTVWKLDTLGNFTVLYSFTGSTDGAIPEAGLLMDPSANLYGDTIDGGDLSCAGGVTGCGVIFKIDSSANFTVLHTFTHNSGDGAVPVDTLIRDANGNLYGMTIGGGDPSCSLGGGFGCGLVFKLDPSNYLTILHAFSGGTTDGAQPTTGALAADGKGDLYGTTSYGGLADVGVIFEVQTQ